MLASVRTVPRTGLSCLVLFLALGCTGTVDDPSAPPGQIAGGNGGGGTRSGAPVGGSGTAQGGSGGTGQPTGAGGTTSAGTGGGAARADAGAGAQGGGGQGGSAGARVDASAGGGGSLSPDSGNAGRDGSAGAGGGAGASGAAGAGPIAVAPPCLNGRKDGTETGVDCGGSCPPCGSYQVNPPTRNNTVQSSCDGGQGYMCARSMLFSPEFKQAAMDDWNAADPPFVYATVGHDPDTGGLDATSNTCCQCYQLVLESPVGATGLPVPKPMIVQVFNTAAGGGKNFDVYVAAGGLGANNGCFGGSSPMYDQFPDLGGNFSGGVKATRYSQCSAPMNQYTAASIASSTCQAFVASQCDLIQTSASASNQSTTQGSCLEANFPESHYHLNWNVRAKRVECPTNLTRVTGCKLNSQGLPAANPAAQDVASADSSFRAGYQTTTMQDCCRPTCAYSGNVANTDPAYSVFYTCNRAGAPAVQ